MTRFCKFQRIVWAGRGTSEYHCAVYPHFLTQRPRRLQQDGRSSPCAATVHEETEQGCPCQADNRCGLMPANSPLAGKKVQGGDALRHQPSPKCTRCRRCANFFEPHISPRHCLYSETDHHTLCRSPSTVASRLAPPTWTRVHFPPGFQRRRFKMSRVANKEQRRWVL